jgi:hypothetical protein
MKTIGLVLSIALTLCTGTLNARAHGGGCGGGCFFWPFLAFGLGLAVASSSQSSSASPVYVYVPSGPVYASPAPVAAPAVLPEPAASSWVPSSPGTGKWVPDPQPYSYTPAAPTAAKVKSTAVSITNSPSGVPLPTVSRTPGNAP